jgi:hypothetical protein
MIWLCPSRFECVMRPSHWKTLRTGQHVHSGAENPNRLEQREGRVDRFGQMAPIVKACLLYGANNPIDGIVLDVILRKIREIKRSTGINVPFPEDSQSIILKKSVEFNPAENIQHKFDKPIGGMS